MLVSRRIVLSGAAALLASCGREEKAPPDPELEPVVPGLPEGTLEWAVAGGWRGVDRARDAWRHPVETLRFMGVLPGQTVVETWPGAGWYTRILAPYLAKNGGRLYLAQFQVAPGEAVESEMVKRLREQIAAKPDLYGQVAFTEFGPTSGPLAPPGSADVVLTFRNLHNWMAAGIAEKFFRDAVAALKPGGKLGIEEHRAEPDGVQDAAAADGYVQEAYVRRLAEEAGLEFEEASEINANPDDTKDHPFGVWTLPPVRRSSPRGQPPDPKFDHSKYDAIGESDRMTLRFRKRG